jgi:hypothetical protein
MENKSSIAIDFDGPINSYLSGWKGPGYTDGPAEGVEEAFKVLSKIFKIIIFSVRAETETGKKTIAEFMHKHNLSYDEITSVKPQALIVDDNALQFRGWKETLPAIANFENHTEKLQHAHSKKNK